MKRPVVIFLLGLGILLSFGRSSQAQWIRAGNPGGGWVTALATKGTSLFAATREGGVFLSPDEGVTWTAENAGLPKEIDVQCLVVNGQDIWAGTVGQGVFFSTDNGARWRAVNVGLPEGSSVFRLEVSGTNVFAVAGSKHTSVFLLADSGEKWMPANSGLPDPEVLCLAAWGENLFAGTGTPLTGDDACVFLSADKGASWKAVNAGLPVRNPIYRFAVIDTHIFAGTWGAGRVFRCPKGSSSWTPVSFGLPDPMDFSLSDLAVRGTNVFLGSFKGVFLSADKGVSWTAVNFGFPEEPSIYCLAVGETDLFAGTEEGEVWRLPLSAIADKK